MTDEPTRSRDPFTSSIKGSTGTGTGVLVELRSFGATAQEADPSSHRSKAEVGERLFRPRGRNTWVSLELIEIRDGPIRWISVGDIKHTRTAQSLVPISVGYIYYGVPDPRLTSEHGDLSIRTARKRVFPLFGRVSDVRWKGKDLGLGVLARLDGDESIGPNLVTGQDVSIGTDVLRSDSGEPSQSWVLHSRSRSVGSPERWDAFQSIARHLLATPL